VILMKTQRVIPLGLSNSAVGEGSHILYPFEGGFNSIFEPVVKYIRTGVSEGDSVACVLPKADLIPLQAHLQDVLPNAYSRNYQLVSADEFFSSNGRFSPSTPVREWSTHFPQTQNLRLMAIATGRSVMDRSTCYKLAEFEVFLNRTNACKTLVCAYDVSVVPQDIMNTITTAHQLVFDGCTIQHNPEYLNPDSFSNYFYSNRIYEFAYPAEPKYCRFARNSVGDIAARMPFEVEEIDDILLAVGEAFANAVKHGSPDGSENRIRIRVVSSDTKIVIEITDEGCGIKCEPMEIDWGEPGGKGLYLMRKVCDNMDYTVSESGCTVCLTKTTSRGRL
jgi:anti-sigma regulatory factor (Ser/Thr protein kinase)